ncbi:flagellar basal body-associated FliL family protein [Wukongibacter baidiensis]|uniref:flagellar basal body-associated FliL family protein n=1 Tax=Wukongibacter baidiensis TaxID=1723361 RepID=UPI003D7FD4A0
MTVKKVILFSLIGLLVLALIFGAIFFFVLNKKSDDKAKKIDYYEFRLDAMYTNLKDSSNILKTSITIEYTNTKVLETLNKSKVKITNSVLELLRSKTAEELSGKEGLQNARKAVLDSVMEITQSKDISNIYFTEFIIQ